jgi:hypothetical protein
MFCIPSTKRYGSRLLAPTTPSESNRKASRRQLITHSQRTAGNTGLSLTLKLGKPFFALLVVRLCEHLDGRSETHTHQYE